jgi:hypothetical protein
MSITTIPSALYKYVGYCRGAQILRHLRIRFSQASVLNDVDEFRPLYKGFASRAETEETVRELLLRQHPTEFANLYLKHPIDQADQLIDQMASIGAVHLEENAYEKIVKGMYAQWDRDCGLLSLSETLTSKLMWSFYCDGGRGVVIEFASSHAWFNGKTSDNDSFHHLRKVRYVDEREPMYLLDTKTDAATKDEAVLYTKTREWKFEDEWRIIRGFNGGQKAPEQDSYRKDVFLLDIPPSAIQAVIFGYRTTSEDETALREIVRANVNLKHIVFRRAVRNVDGKIEIVPDVTGTL